MIIAITTVGAEREAKLIAKVTVSEGLAACVQMDEVKSIYKWKKEMREDSEYRLTFKTSKHSLAALEKRVRSLHGYALPEWVWFEASASKEYEAWVNSLKG